MRVFGAMLLDAYRELNSKALFWVTLALSAIVVLMYASIGFNETGMSLFFGLKQIDSEIIREGTFAARMLYRGIFSSFIVSVWLAWIATILALVSTTTIFPDFVAGGSIDLALSKPIGRIRLFVYKYLTSLLFVLLQVGLFCVGVFLCNGWRLGEWNWMILVTIPILVLFFSYLYAVNVLIGVVTRSALTALLLTLIFWLSIWGLNVADSTITMFRMMAEMRLDETQAQVDALDELAANSDAAPPPDAHRTVIVSELEEQRERLAALDPWQQRIRAVRFVLPKTTETVSLIDRWLKEETDVNLMDIFRGNVEMDSGGGLHATSNLSRQEREQRELEQRIESEVESLSVTYIIGTSLGFEFLVLILACWIFSRRDY